MNVQFRGMERKCGWSGKEIGRISGLIIPRLGMIDEKTNPRKGITYESGTKNIERMDS